MQITDEMVEAFGHAFWAVNTWSKIGSQREEIRAALEAAFAALPSPAGAQAVPGPDGFQWRAVEDGEPRISWEYPGKGDLAGWQALAARNPSKYKVETRLLYAVPMQEAIEARDDSIAKLEQKVQHWQDEHDALAERLREALGWIGDNVREGDSAGFSLLGRISTTLARGELSPAAPPAEPVACPTCGGTGHEARNSICRDCDEPALIAPAVPSGWFDRVMEQVQVFASAYSLVGGRFDNGSAVNDAEEAKAELRALLEAAPAAPVGGSGNE